MNKGTRLQHYVSQFLLRRFCGLDGKLWAYDAQEEKMFCADPKGLAAEGYFYSDTKKYPTETSTAIENWLATGIEGPGSKAIEGLISRCPITPEVIHPFVRFVATQMIRTPTALKRAADSCKPTFQETAERLAKYDPEARKNILEEMKANGASEEDISQMFQILNEGKFQITPTREFSIGIGFDSIELIAAELSKMYWEFAVVPEMEPELIIGDHPVTLADAGGEDKPAEPLGLRNPNIEVVMPLSSRCVALAHWSGPFKYSYGETGSGVATALNERTLRNIHRFAYASFQSKDLLERAIALRGTGPKIHTHRIKVGDGLIIAPVFK